MARRVEARHRIDEAFEAIAGLQVEPVARVRAAARRALACLVAGGP
jgi:hypothetical protein